MNEDTIRKVILPNGDTIEKGAEIDDRTVYTIKGYRRTDTPEIAFFDAEGDCIMKFIGNNVFIMFDPTEDDNLII